MAEYTFDKYMMAGGRLEIAKGYNSMELKNPCAVLIDGDFFTEKGLRDESGLIEDWTISVSTTNPKKSPAPTPTDFEFIFPVAYGGEGLKTEEFYTGDFEADGVAMNDFYSYFPEGTGLKFEDNGGNQYDLYHINSKGDYVTDGTKFTFEEDTESFTITWQDDIPGDKGELVSGFVVRTTPYVDPGK